MIPDYIKVEETVLYVNGIDHAVTLLQITDMHLTLADERETENTRRIAKERTNLFTIFPDKSIPEVFQDIINLADFFEADCIVLTGDIIDFPSKANLEALEQTLNESSRKSLFITGNHDWGHLYIDNCEDRRPEYMQKLAGIMNIKNGCEVKDIEGIKLIALDDSDYQITQEQLSFFRGQIEHGDPCLLFMHIPMDIDSLEKDVISVWKNPIMLGIPNTLPHDKSLIVDAPNSNDTTLEFCRYINEGTTENLYGIFAGHVHFNHSDSYRNNRNQYITAPGYTGVCRKITLVPNK